MADAAAVPTPPKKAAHRSPNHPAFDLPTALDKVRKVYDADKRTPTTPEVIVGHLGYKHTDGPGGRALSCIRQYGLLEDAAGKLKVSDLGFSLLHLPDEDANKANLLKQAALRPALYQALHEEFPEGVPSDPTLRSSLLNRGFNPDSIDKVIADFRATMDVAKVYDGLHNEVEEQSKMQITTPTTTAAIHTLPLRAASGARSYSFPLSPDVRAELNLQGDPTAEDLEMLRDHIELTIKALTRAAKAIEQ